MRCFVFCLLFLMAWWSMPLASAQSTPLWTTQVFSSPIGQLIFSNDSARIIVVSARKDSLAIVDAVTGSVLWRRDRHAKKHLAQVAFSPNGESIAVLEDDGESTRQVAYVLTTATGKLINETAPLENVAQYSLFDSMIFAPDSKGLYLTQRIDRGGSAWGSPPWVFGLIRLWDFTQNAYIDTIHIQNSEYDPWVGGLIHVVLHMDLYIPPDKPDTLIILFNYFWDYVIGYNPPGSTHMTGNGHDIMLYSFTQRKIVAHRMLGEGRGELKSLIFTPDASLIAATCEFLGNMVYYHADGGMSGERLPETYHFGVFDTGLDTVWARTTPYKYIRCFLANDAYALLNDLSVWDYRRDAVAFNLPLSTRETSTCLPLPNANYLLLAGSDSITAGIYNIAEQHWEETYGSTRATVAALSPTFRAFATGSSTGTVSLWQTRDWSSFPDTPVHAEFYLTTSASTISVNQPISFVNLSYPLSANAQFSWDFGDGSTQSTEFQPVHIFNQAGTYSVQLIVTNTEADRDTIIRPVKVMSVVTGIQPEAPSVIADTPTVIPNPSSADGCRIRFSLTGHSTVRITIANVLGEVVAEPLPAMALQAGPHSFEWRTCHNGQVPAAGVYYALVQTGQESFVVPIQILR